MKRLLAFFLITFVLIAGAARAENATATLELLWSQAQAGSVWENISAWRLHWSDSTGGPYTQILSIPRPAQPSPNDTYVKEQIETFVVGTGGQVVTKYFVMNTVLADGSTTAFSNEEMRAIIIPENPGNNNPPLDVPDPPVILDIIITVMVGDDPLPPPDDPPDDPPPVGTGDTAIIFINGLNGSARNANQLFNYLEGKGYDRDLMFAETVSSNSSMCSQNHIEQIENMMSDIWDTTTADNFVLIGHSRGGTIIYNFMWFSGGADLVTTAITLAGANLFNCTSTYGSPPADKTAETALYTNIWSPQDGLVPQAWSVVDGASNVSLSGVGHLSFISNQSVFDEVLKALQGGGSNQ